MPLWGHDFTKRLNLYHVPCIFSLSLCLKSIRSCFFLAFSMGGKNFFMNFFIESSHVVTSPCSRELAHHLALSLNVNWKRANCNSSHEIPGMWNEAQYSRNYGCVPVGLCIGGRIILHFESFEA